MRGPRGVGAVRRWATLAFGLAACREVDAHEYVSPVVWSNDGERVAFAIERFDVSYPRRDPREDRNENFHFEVWTSTLDGRDRQRWRHGEGSVGSLYDMRSSGYLLVESSGRGSASRYRFELLRSPGEVEFTWEGEGHDEVCDGCEIAGMLPSATGARLAVHYSASPWGEPTIHALEILDAADGTSLWGPEILDREAGGGTWTADDEYFLDRRGGTSWRWHEGSDDLEVVDRPACRSSLVPPTTSSPIDADGRLVCGSDDPDAPIKLCVCQQDVLDFDLSWCYQAVPFGECPDHHGGPDVTAGG